MTSLPLFDESIRAHGLGTKRGECTTCDGKTIGTDQSLLNGITKIHLSL